LVLGALGSLLGIHAALAIGGLLALGAGVYAAVRVPVLREWRAPSRRAAHVVSSPTVPVGQPTFR
ncbi:MAG: hypothetical protein M3R54_01185, partial [Chloroflexota bacterium]|nr:hypothetical protein [Chloroflexota bacterium]